MKALNNKIWVTGVIAALSGLALTGAYYLYRKNQKINKKLNKWLESYASFIEEKLRLNNNEINLEIVAYVVNFMNELEEYLFKQDYSEIEADRINNVNNVNGEHEYNELLFKTIEAQDKIFHEACNYVEERFKYSMTNLKSMIEVSTSKGVKEWNELSMKCKFPYYNEDLPNLNRYELKIIYLEYGSKLRQNANEIYKEIMKVQNDPKLQEISMLNIYNIKYRAKDNFRKTHQFNEKYLDTLVQNNKDLSNDNEIKELRELVKTMNSN